MALLGQAHHVTPHHSKSHIFILLLFVSVAYNFISSVPLLAVIT